MEGVETSPCQQVATPVYPYLYVKLLKIINIHKYSLVYFSLFLALRNHAAADVWRSR